jgi:hypothetical protein
MAHLGRYTAAALVAAATLAGGSSAAAEQLDTTIVVHVDDHAAVARDVLAGAMNRVADVYKTIGVRIEWDDLGAAVSRATPGKRHLNVLLLTRDLRAKKIAADAEKQAVLGYAHLASGRAYVFFERVAALPGPDTWLATQLGDVIAHEIGHLMLGQRTHSANGIMRASLGVRTFPLETFNGTEARTIRAALLASR